MAKSENLVPVDANKDTWNMKPCLSPHGSEVFLSASIQLGREFLSCGGPVNRLEDQLVRAGERLGAEMGVQATPSGLFVSVYNPSEGKTYSRMCRVHSSAMDLGLLWSVDRLLGNLANGQMTPQRAIAKLSRILSLERRVSSFRHLSCIFGIGGAAALLSGAPPHLALAGGAFTIGVDRVLNFLRQKIGVSSIFDNFLACFLALLLSKLFGDYLDIPAGFLAIGTLAFIVPGLLMTTAISEIVEQNYISGTIQLVKSLNTFLAMALAYLFVNGLFFESTWRVVKVNSYKGQFPSEIVILKILAAVVITLAVSIEFRSHKKSIRRTLICGLAGASTFFILNVWLNTILSSFLAALVIGALSYRMGRRFHHPSQIYSVPSTMSLVPGMMAFSSFGYGNEISSHPSSRLFIQALFVSLALVFGLAAGRTTLKAETNGEDEALERRLWQ